jgi:hypothetical protein
VRILFDQGTPSPLRRLLPGHEVSTAYELGWSWLRNGELLDAAERDGYEVFLTTDSHLKSQQDLTGRRLAIVVLLSTSWPRIQRMSEVVVSAVDAALPGSFQEIHVPE